jgi:hypothetical protein
LLHVLVKGQRVVLLLWFFFYYYFGFLLNLFLDNLLSNLVFRDGTFVSTSQILVIAPVVSTAPALFDFLSTTRSRFTIKRALSFASRSWSTTSALGIAIILLWIATLAHGGIRLLLGMFLPLIREPSVYHLWVLGFVTRIIESREKVRHAKALLVPVYRPK